MRAAPALSVPASNPQCRRGRAISWRRGGVSRGRCFWSGSNHFSRRLCRRFTGRFGVAAGSLCNTCTDPSGSYLGVGCSDPYGAGLNGSQSGLGPKSEVNASTGVFVWANPGGHGDLPSNGTLDGRLRV